jgi:AraC family transcriptional regulator, regulatory protein of adaptative response / DNA-3-methyladenine glycosylase II
VSLAAGRTFAGRLVQRFGVPGPDGLTVFPDPDRLAAADPTEIQTCTKITGARARSLHAAATAFAADPRLAEPGPLPTARIEECSARLLALPGVGPWTVAYLRLRLLGDRDAFPAGDLVLRKALGGVPSAEAERLSQSWRPLRGYAVFSLWAGTAFP